MYLIPHQVFKIILSASSESMKHWLINHLLKYISTGFRTELTWRLNLGTNLNSWQLRLLKESEGIITKGKNVQNVPHLEIIQVVVVHCNIVSIWHQCDSLVFCTFFPNKSFAQLLSISAINHIYTATFCSELCSKVWFTDQISWKRIQNKFGFGY